MIAFVRYVVGRGMLGDLSGCSDVRMERCLMKRASILLVLVFVLSPYAGLSAQPSIKSEFVQLKTADGISLHGLLWTPATGRARAGIVLASGAGSEFFDDLLVWLGENLARSGYIALS